MDINLKRWLEYFSDIGLPDSVVREYQDYVAKLSLEKVPVIFEIDHLSHLLGIKKGILLSMINSPDSYYREFSIPKRKGGLRKISAPYPSLLHCQEWIYREILLKRPVHISAHGFVPRRSIFTNAAKHLNKKNLLKIDIKDFFPSIPISWVINLFIEIGYSNSVSFYLASICCLNGFLAQGSATSPYLSNILLFGLDNRLEKLSSRHDLVYTRYADDITFSGDYISTSFLKYTQEIIEDYGFVLNSEKTILSRKPGKRIVTGLSVSGSRLKVPREFKRELRSEIFLIKKYGLPSHLSKNKVKDPNYLDVLIGKLNFWHQVEPKNSFTREAIEYIKKIKY